jgi:dTDP-4-dehydrorhamnose 3,5-epimerase
MNILETPLKGVHVVETRPFCDERGLFFRAFCSSELEEILGERRIVQINVSRTATVGAVRGMHYQRPPHAEIKMIRCLKGRVWDVAVDLRAGSPTFLNWHAEELTPDNARMMVIPEGCAHGFQALEQESELLYLHTARYAPKSEGGLSCLDPRLGISWPLPIAELSGRDRCHAPLDPDFQGVLI